MGNTEIFYIILHTVDSTHFYVCVTLDGRRCEAEGLNHERPSQN